MARRGAGGGGARCTGGRGLGGRARRSGRDLRTVRAQPRRDGGAERLGFGQGGDRRGHLHAHQGADAFGVAPGAVQAQGAGVHPPAVGRERHGAAATQGTAHGALGCHAEPGGLVGERRHRLQQVVAFGAHLQAQCALAGGRQHLVGLEQGTDAAFQTQALEARGREHDGVVLAFVELAQAGIEVAAQRLDVEVGAQRLQQHLPAQAGGADHGTLGQVGQAGVAGRDEGIARILALHHAGQLEALGQLHGNVLERMHGHVGAAFFQRDFQLFHEEALAAHLGQGAVEDLVALGGHAEQFDGVAARTQQGLHMFGLPEREAAFARGDDDGREGGGDGGRGGGGGVHRDVPGRAGGRLGGPGGDASMLRRSTRRSAGAPPGDLSA